MNYTRRLIQCERHAQQVVVLVLGSNGKFEDRCVRCRRDELAAERRCACECGELLFRHAANVKYISDRHKQKAHRDDLKARATALGVMPTLTVKALDSATAPDNRRRDGDSAGGTARRAQTKPRKPELRVSYRKAVDSLATWFFDEGLFWDEAVERARHILLPLLTEHQKAAL